MDDSKNRGSDASLFGEESGTRPPRFWTPHRRIEIGMGVSVPHYSLTFSAFREIIREEREVAIAAERAERQAWAAEQRRLLEKALELKLQLLGLKEKQSSGVTGGEPRAI